MTVVIAMKKFWKRYQWQLRFVGLSLLTGAVGGLITWIGMPGFNAAAKPWFTPPQWVFPVAWTLLYVLMGWGMGRVRKRGRATGALWLFMIQLVLNVVWTVWFFLLANYLVAFVWLLGLLCTVVVMTELFRRVDTKAAALQIPYLLWLCFAAVLNLYVYLLN